MPQRALAVWRALAYRHGCDATVCDFGTVEMLTAWRALTAEHRYDRLPPALFRRCAAALAAMESPTVVVFQVRRREDLPVCEALAVWLRRQVPQTTVLAAGPHANAYAPVLAPLLPVFDGFSLGADDAALDAALTSVSRGRCIGQTPGWRTARCAPRSCPTPLPALDMAPEYCVPEFDALDQHQKLRLIEVVQSEGARHVAAYDATVTGAVPGHSVRRASLVCDEMLEVLDGLDGARVLVRGAQTPGAHAESLAYELLARGAWVAYGREAHVSELSPTALALLHSSGCQALNLTVSSGSQRLLDTYYRHGFNTSQVAALTQEARSAQIDALWTLHWPSPADDLHTLDETRRLVERARPAAIAAQRPALACGSLWWQAPGDWGFRVRRRALAAWACGRGPAVPYRLGGWPGGRCHAMRGALENTLGPWCAARHVTLADWLVGDGLDVGGDRGAGPVAWSAVLRGGHPETLAAMVAAFNEGETLPDNVVPFAPLEPMPMAAN